MPTLLSNLPEDFISNFSRTVAASIKDSYRLQLADANTDTLALVVQKALIQILPRNLNLIRNRPDFDAVIAQLMNEVEQSQSWVDADTSSTGQMLLRAIAADVDYGQFSIARALQEAYLHTAQAPSSIYTAARMLGNTILRKRPAQVVVRLSRTDAGTSFTIPAYTQFGIDEVSFVNRNDIHFPAAVFTQDVVLYQGVPQTASVISTGTLYQMVEVGTETWNISNADVQVSVNGRVWSETIEPIWHYEEEDEVYSLNTSGSGNLMIFFGNSQTGKAPPANVPISVRWLETLGVEGNNPIVGMVVEPIDGTTEINAYTGITLTPVTLGENERTPEFYAIFGSDRRAADKRAVRRSDYRAHAVEYPGVIDARFRGQAELGPGRPSFMNVIAASLLTEHTWSEAEFNTFVDWLTKVGIYQCEILRIDPTPIEVDIVATIYCSPTAHIETLRGRHRQQIDDAIKLRPGSLGYSWYLSDIHDLLEGSEDLSELISYAVVTSPTTDTICADGYEYVKFRSITLDYQHTRRENYSGRLDRIQPTPGSGTLKVD